MIGVRGTTLDTIGDVQFRGATLGDIDAIYVRDATGPKLIWSRAATMAVLLPDFAYGYGYSEGRTNITSEVVEAAVTGGTAPFTYLWEGVTDATEWAISTPTASNTRFRLEVAGGEAETATFKVTVTDSLGQSVESDIISVTLTNVWTSDV